MNTKKIISAICGAVLAVSAAVPAFSASAAEGDFIQITVGISNAGSVEVPNNDLIVYDRDNDGKYTIDEALYCAHEMYYSGGTAGYATEQSDWGLSLKTLWGVTNGGSYGYYVNDTMAMGLTDELKSGDYLYAYVFQDAANFSDKYSFFNYKQKDIKSGETVEATLSALLFDENWAPYTAPVKNARITVDGEDTDFVTDENGKVTLSLGDAGHLIISAKSNDLVLAPPVMIVDIDAAETTAIGDSDATTTTATTTMPEDNVTTTPDAVTTPAAATTSTAGSTTTAAPAAGTTTKAPSNANSSGSSSKTDAAKTGDTASVTAIALAALLAGGTAVAFRRRKNNG
ncbi:MAG TPA: hypothetical protein DCP68_03560 [Ruminococcus sp.]|nr:hypothetical protein [Ruminococcus sp.]